jgi:hypothetical protein
MATQTNIPDVEVGEEDMSKLSTAEFYASAKHQAVRKWLGRGNRPRELPPLNWVPNEEWRKGRGILSDHPEHDTTEMKARNRAEEEEHDARKFGSPSQR